jgi:DNA-binding NtrC family response regulator
VSELSARGVRVLVVDDDVAVRGACRAALELEGFLVDTASDGFEAVRRFHDAPARVLVCDIFMPGKDGFETISELTRDYRGLEIVAMTGGEPLHLDLARLLGARETLAKPFGADELVAAVRRAAE